eukprot:3810538-Prymnesium_polylepis.1
MGPSRLGPSKLYKALTNPNNRAQRARVRCVPGSGPTTRAEGGTLTLSLSTVSGQRKRTSPRPPAHSSRAPS